MTESEAKTKWCPMVRITVGEGSIIANGPHAVINDADGFVKEVSHNCIASACMMWRPIYKDLKVDGITQSVAVGGYCGLAGKL